jgi:DNA-binding response OmpR family regulator
MRWPDAPPLTGSDPVDVDTALVPVLIVEDDANTQFVYQKSLQGSRYQPFGAQSLREARQLLSHIRPRAIILDIALKGEDTWRWLGEIKAAPETMSIPVIVASTIDDQRKGLALGANSYLAKPVHRAALLMELDALTGRQVLVIDDDPAARYLVQKLVSDSRTHVIEANDARSGLIAARRSHPALILLDLHLPDANGEDVLKALRLDTELNGVPVAIVTSQSLSTSDRKRLGAGAQAVLEKHELTAQRARELLALI